MSEITSNKPVYATDSQLDTIVDAVVINPSEMKQPLIASFNFDGIDIMKTPREAPDHVAILPVMAAARDGRSTEIIGGYIGDETNPTTAQSLDLFKTLVTAIDTQDADESAKMFVEAADMVRKSGDADFVAPAMLSVNQQGELAWSASQNNQTTGLIRIRRNQAFERLGADGENDHGVIRDLTTKDAMYIVPNELADRLQAAGELNEASIKAAFLDKDGPDVVRAKFTDALPEGTASEAFKQASNRQKVRPRSADAQQSNAQKNQKVDLPTTQTSVSGAKPDDAYDVTYDNQYSGPMPAHALDRSQTRDVRELVTSDDYKNAHDVYNAADQALAAKVGRRLKLGMFASKKTRETHSAEVEAQRIAYERMSEGFDAIQIEKWKLGNPNISEKELAGKLANYHEAKLRLQGLRSQNEIVTTHGKFGKLSEWSDKATEWYSRQSKGTKVAIAVGSVAVGALGGLLVATAGTAIGGAAGVVGGGMLAAAKVKKTHMQSRAGLYRNTIAVDKTRIENADGTYKSALTFQEESAAALKDSLGQRAEKADKINKKTRRMTIASAALLGAGIASHIDVIHDVYQTASDHVGSWLDSLHLSGSSHHVDAGISPSQGGGSGHNSIDKLGSGDVYHAPSIDTSIADAAAAAHSEFMNSVANVIPTGGGGEAFMSAHGINPSVWYNNQAEFLAKFPSEAYQMSDGNVGFAKAGGLSKTAVEFWATKAGR